MTSSAAEMVMDGHDWSSSSGFGGSLFSGGATGTSSGTAEEEVGPPARRRGAAVMAMGGVGSEDWAQRARESYYLQLTLATRVTWQAFLAEDREAGPLQMPESAPEVCGASSDSGTVSYRLWVMTVDLYS